MKYNMDQKLKMVHEYLDDKVSTLKLSKKYGYDHSKIKYMIKLYEMHGEAPFDERQASRVYTREQKLIAMKEVLSREIHQTSSFRACCSKPPHCSRLG